MTVVSTLPPSATVELDKSIILNIFSTIGRCRILEEKHFDACTALAGSGPAFACIFLEAMADGGVMMGLPRAEALELAAQSTFPEFALAVIGPTYVVPSAAGCCPDDAAAGYAPRTTQRFRNKCVPSRCSRASLMLSVPSPGRLYHRWPACNGGWQSAFHYCSCHTGSNGKSF